MEDIYADWIRVLGGGTPIHDGDFTLFRGSSDRLGVSPVMNPFNFIPWILILVLGGTVIGGVEHYKRKLDKVPVLEQQLANAKATLAQTQKAYQQSEAYRKQEQQQAETSVDQVQQDCEVRIAEAKRTASTIRNIVHATPKLNAAGCPVRELYDPRVLRDALGAKAR